MSTRLVRTTKVALLSCVVALSAMRTADAAFVVINADPVYGAQFPGLSWRAVGALYIPDTCLNAAIALNTPPFIAINPLGVPLGNPLANALCGNSRIQDVQLQFYDSGTGAIVDTLAVGTYVADSPPPNTDRDLLLQELISFTLRDGALDAFSTTLSTPLHSAAASAYLAPGSVPGGERCFALELSSATARVESFSYNTTTGLCGTTIDPRPPGDAGNPATQPTVTFNGSAFIPNPAYVAPTFASPPVGQNVPEPATPALVLLAALAAAAVGRRASRKTA